MCDEKEYSNILEDDEHVQTTKKTDMDKTNKVNTKSYKAKISKNLNYLIYIKRENTIILSF